MLPLSSLTLSRFKCFSSQTISLSAATVLTGINGMGKSSVIQSLLLLRQSARADLLRRPNAAEAQAGLLLNGEYTQLGTSTDVLYEGAQDDSIGIRLQTDAESSDWLFGVGQGGSGPLDLLPWLGGPDQPPAIALFSSAFAYLGAERVGPRPFHALSASRTDRYELGADGAFAVAYLDAHGEQEVPGAVQHPTTPGLRLLQQMTAWMGEISPGVRIQTQAIQEVSLARLSFSFATGGATSRTLRPTSVGFGLSYTLPVVLALLATPPNGLVMIENPEAHLHPRGQMAMGELIIRAAAAGIQVLVETHSDHVLNGMRVAIKDGLCPPERLTIHYFRRITERKEGDERIVHVIDSPRIDADGRLDRWPTGFFDQYDLALERLL